ncbi:hypothetical protein GPECTOR_6g502 [Gonium pectorale]|uniref:FAD-binding PCMH-type domain-containing protein n=1 Tax=Gonium pectorale TaxID=33097 RepID=A0A150GUN8_GONPE|nr:hypothetical protein GPECTOR_6g502 [Gonium pectorale]|eukprot:KXZ53585.1 hypothetical protein GPECTOR_6g502 [Gonium pectorale]
MPQSDAAELEKDMLALGMQVQVVDEGWSLPSWNGLLCELSPVIKPGRPSLCCTPESKDDVVAACELAHRHNLKVSARGSGHHYGGVSSRDGCLLIDLARLRNVHIDPVSRTARVGPAASCRQLRAALAPLGLHFPLPHLSDVGLSGFLLGGGNGWGTRLYGAAADNVLEVEAVVLDGGGGGDGGGRDGGGCRLVRVSEESDPELFWGMRGGGAFLAVAVEFVLRLTPGPRALPLIAATYPLGQFAAVASFYHAFHTSTSPCFEASMSIVGAGGSGDDGGGGGAGAGGGGGARPAVVLACTAFAEPDSPEVEAAYGKVRSFLPECRLSLQEGPMPLEEALSILDPAWNWPGLCMYGHGTFLPVDALRPPPAAAAAGGGGDSGAGGGVAAAAGCDGAAPLACTSGAACGSASVSDGGCPAAAAVVAALAASGAAITSPRSLLLVCPSAPSRPATAGESDDGGGPGCGGGAGGGMGTADRPAGQPCLGCFGFRDSFYVGIYAMWTRSEVRGGPGGRESVSFGRGGVGTGAAAGEGSRAPLCTSRI